MLMVVWQRSCTGTTGYPFSISTAFTDLGFKPKLPGTVGGFLYILICQGYGTKKLIPEFPGKPNIGMFAVLELT